MALEPSAEAGPSSGLRKGTSTSTGGLDPRAGDAEAIASSSSSAPSSSDVSAASASTSSSSASASTASSTASAAASGEAPTPRAYSPPHTSANSSANTSAATMSPNTSINGSPRPSAARSRSAAASMHAHALLDRHDAHARDRARSRSRDRAERSRSPSRERASGQGPPGAVPPSPGLGAPSRALRPSPLHNAHARAASGLGSEEGEGDDEEAHTASLAARAAHEHTATDPAAFIAAIAEGRRSGTATPTQTSTPLVNGSMSLHGPSIASSARAGTGASDGRGGGTGAAHAPHYAQPDGYGYGAGPSASSSRAHASGAPPGGAAALLRDASADFGISIGIRSGQSTPRNASARSRARSDVPAGPPAGGMAGGMTGGNAAGAAGKSHQQQIYHQYHAQRMQQQAQAHAHAQAQAQAHAQQPQKRAASSPRAPHAALPSPGAGAGAGAGSGTPPLSAAEASRKREREREREAARAAEREAWERTRGAGSAVLDILDTDAWRQRQAMAAWRRRTIGPPRAGADKEEPGDETIRSSASSNSDAAAAAAGGIVAPASEQSDPSSSSPTLSSASDDWQAEDVLPTLEEVQSGHFEPVEVPSADLLLSRGISEYTILPKILGRGKFSTVFLAVKNGERYAIKHTPLFPHHHLISTRLLREPTLLAELPPHPNLVTVNETIRTPGHFYLVEEYLGGYVTLEALLTMKSQTQPPQLPQLPLDIAESVLTQLLAAVHAIHHPLQICHRDIKPENILVHPETLQLKLLDFGLATHFSKSEPKLSTCCGSPAFHCPEIVHALASPPGAVQYWGPEVDAWTCGITMVRVLTGIRYPLGASHASLRSMAIRAQRAVAMIQDVRMREKIGMLLEMDGVKRMRYFHQLVSEQERVHGEQPRGAKEFKSTTFIPTEPAHTMQLRMATGAAAEMMASTPHPRGMTGFYSNAATPVGSRAGSRANSRAPSPSRLSPNSASNMLVLLNTSGHPPQRLLSFIKYCLRCAGVLYHCWAETTSVSSLLSNALDRIVSPGALGFYGNAEGGTFSMPGTPGWELPPSPTTPLFPVMGERSDGWGHVYVFECVMEMHEPEEDEKESQGSLSLVQTIMAAFSRKPTEPNTKRSSSTPAREKSASRAKSSSGSASKGQVKCLRFYLVVRFPRTSSGHSSAHPSRPAFLPSSSYAGKRSRASSAAGVDGSRIPSSDNALKLVANGTSGDTPTRVSIDKNEVHAPHGAPTAQENTLQIVTAPDALLHLSAASQSRSPPRSRNSSRNRRRVSSTAGLNKRSSRRGKVFIQVSDERAVEVVKKALSQGGVLESSDIEDDGATDGNDTDTSRRSMTKGRQGLPRSHSSSALSHSHSRPSSRGNDAIEEPRGRTLGRRQPDDERKDVAAVKEESPSSFDLEAMITDCGNHLDKALHPSAGTLEVTEEQTADQALKAARDSLVAMSKTFATLERTDSERLREILSPWTFNLFSAVSPALGIDAEALLSAEMPSSAAQGPAIRFLGSDVLQIAARNLSPREVFVAIQERLELMLAGTSTVEIGEAERGVNGKPQERKVAEVWTGALELASLLQLLHLVLPRLQSKKPHKFTETLAETVPRAARHLVEKLAPPTQDASEGAARAASTTTTETLRTAVIRELCQSLCSLTDTLIAWESAMLKELGVGSDFVQRASENVLALFFGGLTALLPSLPTLNGTDAGLAECHFQSRQPKYALDRPMQPNPALLSASITSMSSGRTVLQKDSGTDLWSRINEATQHLRTNLVELSFEHRVAAQGISTPSATLQGTVSLGSYLLLVQLLARGLHNDSLGTEMPAQWGPQQAVKMLTNGMPTLMAGLGAKLPPMLTATGTAALGGASALADAALLWLMWCFEGLMREDRIHLEEEVSLPLVQLLASHAALSATPSSRHISVRLLRDLLVHLVDEPFALEQIKDLIVETSYPPLKAACVGLLKDVLHHKPYSSSMFWGERTLQELQSTLLVDIDIPRPDVHSEHDLKVSWDGALAALEERTSWISEVAHLFYFVLRRDSENKTGIKSAATLTRLRTEFVTPLKTILDAWESAFETPAAGSVLSARGPDDDIRLPLNIIRLALDQMVDAMPDVTQQESVP